MLSKVVDKWKGIRDPGIVRLHEAFTSTLLDQEPSLFLVYDYHPQARSLSSLTSSPHSSHALSPFFQLASTLLRYPTVYLHPTKILVQAPFYRINAVGVADFLALPIPSPSQQLCAVLANVHGCQRVCQQLRAGGSVKDVIAHHAHGLLDELEHWRRNQDVLDWELRKSKENDRLARLLIKLNFITERPEYLQDPSWSETGDRYFLKLFRDYVFHMVDEEGRPSLDLGHVIASLNKLDAGVPDQVVLTSRDDRNYLIVSYAELKKYMDAAFMELLEASQSPISPTSSHS
ncbi:hypothetical protein HMI56_004140 [Coelomomyces lativittatus]|nr:hypothetical protein HMI56_004140 [Coelomomyces lativittatus]